MENLTEEEVLHRKQKLVDLLLKSKIEIQEIEINTRGQSSNTLWKQERAFRITASNFGRVCKIKESTNPEKLVKNILYTTFKGNEATRYGQEHEPVAIQDFEDITGYNVSSCGFFIGKENEYFLGASPDGIIENDPDSILEIKCPHVLKNATLEDAVKNKKVTFLLFNEVKGEFELKKNHDYHYQIQGQLHITGKKYCYFVVWFPLQSPYIELIEKDDNFYFKNMKSKLSSFYFSSMAMEIIKNI